MMQFSHRREFLSQVARSTLGVSLIGAFAESAHAAAHSAKAKHVIYLFMDGAMSHLDTFDPKVGVPEAGETRAIPTVVAGIQFGDRFPKLASQADKLAVVRSLSTETGDHDGGRYLMRTAYKKIGSIRHPAMGAWMINHLGRLNEQLPGNILIGSGNRHPGAGFLPPAVSPVPIAKATAGLQNIRTPQYVTEELFDRRLALAEKFDRTFQSRRKNANVEAYNQMYTETRKLMGSEDLKSFDLNAESSEMKSSYGENEFGQGCLLARRLVQGGARFVEVSYGGWDMHQELYESLDERGPIVDQAVSALLQDLSASGLIDETLVVLTTEFGRKPNMNANGGRDHHPGAFCSLLAGAGIRVGQAYGSSDKRGFSVDSDHVSVSSFNRTIASAAGLPLDQEFVAPNGRPFKIGGDDAPVEGLLLS